MAWQLVLICSGNADTMCLTEEDSHRMTLIRRLISWRFSLRTLFLLVLLSAIWMGQQARWIRQRHDLQEKHRTLAASLEERKHGASFWLELQQVCGTNRAMPPSRVSAPGLLWLFGEAPVERLHLHFTVTSAEQKLPFDDPEIDLAQRLFPEAVVIRSVHAFSSTSFPD